MRDLCALALQDNCSLAFLITGCEALQVVARHRLSHLAKAVNNTSATACRIESPQSFEGMECCGGTQKKTKGPSVQDEKKSQRFAPRHCPCAEYHTCRRSVVAMVVTLNHKRGSGCCSVLRRRYLFLRPSWMAVLVIGGFP